MLLLSGLCRISSVTETKGVFHTPLVKASHDTGAPLQSFDMFCLLLFTAMLSVLCRIGDRVWVTVACSILLLLCYLAVMPCYATAMSCLFMLLLCHVLTMPCSCLTSLLYAMLAMLSSCCFHAMLCYVHHVAFISFMPSRGSHLGHVS